MGNRKRTRIRLHSIKMNLRDLKEQVNDKRYRVFYRTDRRSLKQAFKRIRELCKAGFDFLVYSDTYNTHFKIKNGKIYIHIRYINSHESERLLYYTDKYRLKVENYNSGKRSMSAAAIEAMLKRL